VRLEGTIAPADIGVHLHASAVQKSEEWLPMKCDPLAEIETPECGSRS
jgi:hypothetical protein